MHPGLQFWMEVAQLLILIGIVVRLGILSRSVHEVRRIVAGRRS